MIDRSKSTVSITQQALRVIRPINEEDKAQALREMALTPVVFRMINEKYSDCASGIIASQLVHQGYSDDGALRASKVFESNRQYLEFNGEDEVSENVDNDEVLEENEEESNQETVLLKKKIPNPKGDNVLATYTIPLGQNEAQLTFSGKALEIEDFDALIDYVNLFKAQFSRKAKSHEDALKGDLSNDVVESDE